MPQILNHITKNHMICLRMVGAAPINTDLSFQIICRAYIAAGIIPLRKFIRQGYDVNCCEDFIKFTDKNILLDFKGGNTMLNGKTVLITGGTGSFGNYFTEYLLKNYSPKKIIIYSRDEYKQFIMANKLRDYAEKLRFFYWGYSRSRQA